MMHTIRLFRRVFVRNIVFANPARLPLKHLFWGALLHFALEAGSQSIYITAEYPGQQNSTYDYLIRVDPATCTVCPVYGFYYPYGEPPDMVLLPNGELLISVGGNVGIYTPPAPYPVDVFDPSQGGAVIGMILAPDGLVYLAQNSGLGVFDPAGNQFTYLGNWPSGVGPGELWFQGSTLYMYTYSAPQQVLQIDVSNPPNSVIIGPLNGGYMQSASSFDGTVYMSNFNEIFLYDTATQTNMLACDLDGLVVSIGGMAYAPGGFPDLPCLCDTDAGTVNTSVFNICIPGSVTVPFNNNETLDTDDILRYILFSDPADTLGSIIVQSSSPVIAFDPATMQTDVAYYLATIAGDNLNGNVDLADPCLDISNTAAQVTWRPLPAVAFSVNNPAICAGECRTVMATFTGTPPFSLTYNTPFGAFTQTFGGNTGTFQVCAPAGTPPGTLTVQATSLTDAWCLCQ